MSSATLAPSAAPVSAPSFAVQRAVVRLADAVAEYDAALDLGAPMHVLVRLDQEVAAAARGHRVALAGC